MREGRRTGAVKTGKEFLSDKGGDTGLAGAAKVVGRGRARFDVGKGLKRVVADGEEAGGTSGVERDGRVAFVRSGTAGKAARGGCGRREAGERIVDAGFDGEKRLR